MAFKSQLSHGERTVIGITLSGLYPETWELRGGGPGMPQPSALGGRPEKPTPTIQAILAVGKKVGDKVEAIKTVSVSIPEALVKQILASGVGAQLNKILSEVENVIVKAGIEEPAGYP